MFLCTIYDVKTEIINRVSFHHRHIAVEYGEQIKRDDPNAWYYSIEPDTLFPMKISFEENDITVIKICPTASDLPFGKVYTVLGTLQ